MGTAREHTTRKLERNLAGPNLVCPVCGRAFHRAPSQIRGRTVCCSKDCSYIGRRTRVKQVCANKACGREFWRERSQVEHNSTGVFYCSQSCQQVVNRSEDVICANCGKPMRRRPSLRCQSATGEFCCSHECRHELTVRRRAERSSQAGS
jgi:hypothetical protein